MRTVFRSNYTCGGCSLLTSCMRLPGYIWYPLELILADIDLKPLRLTPANLTKGPRPSKEATEAPYGMGNPASDFLQPQSLGKRLQSPVAGRRLLSKFVHCVRLTSWPTALSRAYDGSSLPGCAFKESFFIQHLECWGLYDERHQFCRFRRARHLL